MMSSNFLQDDGCGYQVCCNMVGLMEGHFFTIGKMLATILVQGGSILPLFSHSLISYGLNGDVSKCVQWETIRDKNAKEVIKKIQDAEEPCKLMDDDTVADLIESARIPLMLSKNTQASFIKALVYHCSELPKLVPMMDAFWHGAENLGLRSLLKEHPDVLEKLLCHKCGSTEIMSAQSLIDLIDFEKFGPARSNRRHQSEDVSQNFESFVFDCEDGKCTDGNGCEIKVADVLKFITGCSVMPPGGFDSRFIVKYTEEQCYPYVSTCTFTLTLPLNL